MKNKPDYDGHNRSNHPKTSMKDLRHRRTRRKFRDVLRSIWRNWRTS